MTVYVDLLFGLNACINYLLLRGSAAIGGHPAKPLRLLAGACLGGAYAVAVLLPGLRSLQSTWAQLLMACLMLLAAFGWKRYTVKEGLFFFALSFAFGGAVYLLVQWVEPDCVFLGSRAYYAVSIPALLLLAGLGYGLTAVVLSGWGAHTGGDIQTMVLELDGRKKTIRVLRDTGNTLRDPISGQTVLVAGWNLLGKLLPEQPEQAAFRDPGSLLQALSGRYPKLCFCLVPYRAVGVERGLLLAAHCSLKRGRRRERILAAFSPTAVGEEGKFDALWGGEIV